MAQERQRATRETRLVGGSIPSRGNEIFTNSILRSGNEAKRTVEYRKQAMPPIRRKVGNGSVLIIIKCLNTRFPGSF